MPPRVSLPVSELPRQLWAGRIVDSFCIDLSLLSVVNAALKGGTAIDLSGWRPEDAHNSFDDTTVESIVLEVSNQRGELERVQAKAAILDDLPLEGLP